MGGMENFWDAPPPPTYSRTHSFFPRPEHFIFPGTSQNIFSQPHGHFLLLTLSLSPYSLEKKLMSHGSRSNKGSKQRQVGSRQRQVASFFFANHPEHITMFGLHSAPTGSHWNSPYQLDLWFICMILLSHYSRN